MNAISYQAIFSTFWRIGIRCFIASFAAGMVASAVESDRIIILVDQSKSVDETNRKEALELVATLMKDGTYDLTKWEADQGAKDHLDKAEKGLAKDQFQCIAAAVGNYNRTADLRKMLKEPERFSIENQEIIPWLESKNFASIDNSTHLTLAQSLVAKSTILEKESDLYYLMVISDFKEDCNNSALSVYSVDSEFKKLQQKNEEVFKGEIAYQDGGSGTGKYSHEDISAIKSYREKIATDKETLVGTFTYQLPLNDKSKIPVALHIYAPSIKRVFECNITKNQVDWNIAESPPELGLKIEGFEDGEQVSVTVGKIGYVTTVAKLTTEDPWLAFLSEDRKSSWKINEPTNIKLSVVANKLTQKTLEIAFSIKPIPPQIIFDGDVDKSTEEKPYTLPSDKPLKDTEFTFELNPAPKAFKAEVKNSKKKATPIESGVIELGSFLAGKDESEEDGTENMDLTIDITNHFPYSEKISRKLYLKLPRNEVWAEIDGIRKSLSDETFKLGKSGAISLKATYAGTTQFEWRKPSVIRREDNSNVSNQFSDENNLDFTELAPGEYEIKAKFEFNKEEKSLPFSVIVPKRTPWMLIVVGIMALVSIALFTFHFLRR